MMIIKQRLEKLSSIAELLNGYAFKSKNYVEHGIRIIRIANVQDGFICDEHPCYYPLETVEEISKYILHENDLLLSLTGNVGRVGLLPPKYLPAALNQRVSCIRLLSDEVNLQYLFYYLHRHQFKTDCINASKGVAQLNLSTKWLENYIIPVPPLDEQARIVARIEELFSQLESGVVTLKQTKAQLALYRQAVLKEAFKSSIDWNSTTLGGILTILTDYHANGSYKVLKDNVTLLDEPDYAIMVRSTNFEKNDFKKDVKYISKSSYDFLKKSQLFGDEILMGKIGNAGRVYYLKPLGCPMSLAMNMFAMRFNDAILSKYVYYYLKSPTPEAEIKHLIKGVGTPTIDKKSVRSIRIQFPYYTKQEEIVQQIESRLSVCDQIEQTVDAALQQAEALRQSILKKAFEGGL